MGAKGAGKSERFDDCLQNACKMLQNLVSSAVVKEAQNMKSFARIANRHKQGGAD